MAKARKNSSVRLKTKSKTVLKAITQVKGKPKAKAVIKSAAKAAVSSAAKAAVSSAAKAAVKTKAKKIPKVVSSMKEKLKNTAPILGETVPSFKLPSTAGDFDLSALRGKKVILYFYPKDSTPGCTIEGKEFSDHISEFKSLGAEVFGISRDSLKSHDNFKCKMNFHFELLSDQSETACQLFDVIKEKNMYGRKVMGLERSTFVVDEDGKLAAEWRQVKAEGHAKLVLEKIKSLSQ